MSSCWILQMSKSHLLLHKRYVFFTKTLIPILKKFVNKASRMRLFWTISWGNAEFFHFPAIEFLYRTTSPINIPATALWVLSLILQIITTMTSGNVSYWNWKNYLNFKILLFGYFLFGRLKNIIFHQAFKSLFNIFCSRRSILY